MTQPLIIHTEQGVIISKAVAHAEEIGDIDCSIEWLEWLTMRNMLGHMLVGQLQSLEKTVKGGKG